MPRLRVLAGPTVDSLVPITDLVNTGGSHDISSELFEGRVIVHIKGFPDEHGEPLDSEYFNREDRKGVTWSIQVQGRFLRPHSADDILFGNVFERPLKLPWGSGAALKFMHLVDPTLDHDLTSSTKPWALSPLVSTMPHFAHTRLGLSRTSSESSLDNVDSIKPLPSIKLPQFPSETSLKDDSSHLLYTVTYKGGPPSSSNSSLSSIASTSSVKSTLSTRSLFLSPPKPKFMHKKSDSQGIMNLRSAGDRRSYFSSKRHRQDVMFGPNDVITTDFCYGFLDFSPKLMLRLPGGITFDLVKYWDGQPVRFVCCERKQLSHSSSDDESTEESTGSSGSDDENPWGRLFWCISIELVEDDESDERLTGDVN